MPLEIRNIRLELDAGPDALRRSAARRLGVDVGAIVSLRLLRKAVDARKKADVHFNCHVLVFAADEKMIAARCHDRDVLRWDEPVTQRAVGDQPLRHRPVIVGAGPCGLFAALELARAGFAPIILERGEPVEKRAESVALFWRTGQLDPESNALFGEGGAGTFSDGKLTSRGKDPRAQRVLADFVTHGAPGAIAYEAKPHIGSDALRTIIASVRAEIESLGGTFAFGCRFESWTAGADGLSAVAFRQAGEVHTVETNVCLLAIGHSARDTYETLLQKGVPLEPKSFAVGVRIEHPQELIDRAQYGTFAGHPALGAADYRLAAQSADGRGVYSFCMCPGGSVVAAASESGGVVTNGMSLSDRGCENANAAIVVQVGPNDFGTAPLDGMHFQRHMEKQAYAAGGGGFIAPAQRLGDFVSGRATTRFGAVAPSYRPGVRGVDLRQWLPRFCSDAIAHAIPRFARQIAGFDLPDAVLTGFETRTSAPVRIPRGPDGECITCPGLYPAGEGAGYAGGIVSAAVDGLRTAERIVSRYRPTFS